MTPEDLVVALDDDDRVAGMSPIAARLFDIDETAIGRRVEDVLGTHPDVLDQLVETQDDSELALTVDGETRQYDLATSSLVHSSHHEGSVTAIERVVVLRETRAMEERERALELYRTVVEESPDGVTHIRPDGTMAYVNGAEGTVGRTPEEFIDEPLETFVHPDDKERAREFFEGLLGDEAGRVQARFERGDGSWMWIETTGTTVTDSRVIDGAVTISRDITERKRREQRLERQNERLDRFASVVSHDLRSPLSVASGYAEVAERTGDEEAFQHLRGALDRMETIIEKLLVLARAETTVEETKTVSLSEQARLAWETTGTPGAELAVADPSGFELDADPALFKHVLENLFRNATDHNEAPLTVSVGTLNGDDGPDGFYVEDDGQGIEPADRESVFKHGYTTHGDGVGFGLSIVDEFVEAHGWEATVTEGTRGGARFEILVGSESGME